MKEASGNLGQVSEIIDGKPEGFQVVSGDDSLTLKMLRMGAEGVISVIGNALPHMFGDLVHRALANPGDERFLKEEDLLVYHNRTSDYAKTKKYEIQVIDENQNPVEQACVQIELLNMAEYNRIATVYTDREGKAAIVLGLGDIRIRGKKGHCQGVAFGSVGNRDKVCLKLTKDPVWGAMDTWISRERQSEI